MISWSHDSEIVSIVSGGENGGHEGYTSYRRIFIQNWDPLDHRYQRAWKAKDYLVTIAFDQLVQLV